MILTNKQLLESLKSNVCLACGQTKRAKQTLCGHCFFCLPVQERAALYDLLGSGYAEAVDDALNYLRVETPHLAGGAK
jgi:hypothetical protein